MTDSTTGTLALDVDLVPAKEGQLAFHAGMSLGQLAKTISGSGCFGRDVNPYVAAVKILAGDEIGIGPVEAMRGLHVFDGKIELGSAVMASKIKGSKIFDYEVVASDDDGTTIACFEKSIRTGEWRGLPNISFTRKEASAAGLLNRGPWKTYFTDMCFARCMSRFFRRYCPHLAGGAVYADGEVSGDLKPDPKPPGRGSRPEGGPPGPEAPPAEPGIEIEEAQGPAAGDPAPQQVDPDDVGDPRDHPYARFIDQSGDLKAAILKSDGGDEARYRAVFTSRGIENRAGVGKGDTKKQREILLDLHEALKEALGDKASLEVGMDPDVQTGSAELRNPAYPASPELPFV
tara:strand:- start:6144 stop:7181 length:1038 start_codon:yes stop_codon:yes gene_type:complete